MKWIAIAGTWRKTTSKIENDIREMVKNIILRGEGIVSGGALGVDSIALDEALKHNPTANNIKIYIPSTLDIFKNHYRTRAVEGVITVDQAEILITQLERLQKSNPDALIEGKALVLNKETYFNRITKIINAADELIAFQINLSEGTQDTIDKAKMKNIPVKVFNYTLE